jgi:hypothetical protein
MLNKAASQPHSQLACEDAGLGHEYDSRSAFPFTTLRHFLGEAVICVKITY